MHELTHDLIEQLNTKSMQPVAMLDDPFYEFLDSVTLKTVWTNGTDRAVLYVTIKRTSGMFGNFGWSIERDTDDLLYRDIVGYSPYDEFSSALSAYEDATRSIEDSFSRGLVDAGEQSGQGV